MRNEEIRLLEGVMIDRRTAILLTADAVSVAFAFLLAYTVSPHLKELLFTADHAPLAHFRDYAWLLLIIYPVYMFTLALRGLYNGGASRRQANIVTGVLYASLVTLTFLTLFMFLFKIQYISRFTILVFSFLLSVSTVLVRLILPHSDSFLRKLEGKPQRILVVGSRRRAKDFLESTRRSPTIEILGCVDTRSETVGRKVGDTVVVGTTEDPRTLLAGIHPDLIVIAMPLDKIPGVEEFLTACEEIGVPIMIMPDYHLTKYQKNLTLSRMSIERYCGIPMLRLATTTHSRLELFVKRVMDCTVSAVLLLLLLPAFALIAVLVRATSEGPVFYRWQVTGRNGREFTGYKFRTMVADADRRKAEFAGKNEMSGPVFKMKEDPRITPVGRWLRKFSLDELPQLYSVLRGDMSLVGPRPPLRTEAERFEFWQRKKLSVKPGITCLWQVNGRNSISDFSEWVKLDLEYIDNWSLRLDFIILLRTIPAVLRGTGR